MPTQNKSTVKSGRAGRGRGIQGRGRGGRTNTTKKMAKSASKPTTLENFFQSYGIDTNKAAPSSKRVMIKDHHSKVIHKGKSNQRPLRKPQPQSTTTSHRNQPS